MVVACDKLERDSTEEALAPSESLESELDLFGANGAEPAASRITTEGEGPQVDDVDTDNLVEGLSVTPRPYFVSLTRKGHDIYFRRLHCTDNSSCSVKPGFSSLLFEWVADYTDAVFDAVCFKCWPREAFNRTELEAHIGRESSSDSESGEVVDAFVPNRLVDG